MNESSGGLEFHHMPYGKNDLGVEYTQPGDVSDMFEFGNSVPAEVVKNYTQQIIEQIKQSPNLDTQKACIIDLLREENVKKLLKLKLATTENKEETEQEKKDKEEIEKMVFYWVKRIQKEIVDKLKNELPDDLYFFVETTFKNDFQFANERRIIRDTTTNKLFFLKDSDVDSVETRDRRIRCLNILRSAINSLKDPENEMPFIIAPEIIGQNLKPNKMGHESVSYGAKPVDFLTIDNRLVELIDGVEYYKQLTDVEAKKVMLGIVDCLKGTKFLAKLNLTLTDLNTDPIGKNLGIRNTNGRGVLFDMDGLQQVGHNMSSIAGQTKTENEKTKQDINALAPEYRFADANTMATAESMIWEIGDSILRLSKIQTDTLYKAPNFFANQNLISVWDKLRDFSILMTAEKPADRPSFDVCITKLKEIINKLSDQQ